MVIQKKKSPRSFQKSNSQPRKNITPQNDFEGWYFVRGNVVFFFPSQCRLLLLLLFCVFVWCGLALTHWNDRCQCGTRVNLSGCYDAVLRGNWNFLTKCYHFLSTNMILMYGAYHVSKYGLMDTRTQPVYVYTHTCARVCVCAGVCVRVCGVCVRARARMCVCARVCVWWLGGRWCQKWRQWCVPEPQIGKTLTTQMLQAGKTQMLKQKPQHCRLQSLRSADQAQETVILHRL